MTTDGTRDGAILGTVAYMSPEQARGKPIDKRTDIWSFGCVLFEMLTGRSPFGGETVPDMIVAILEREPDWHVLPDSTLPDVRRLLQRCLEKDPKRRLHDVADVRIEIEDAIATSASGRPASSVADGGTECADRAATAVATAFRVDCWRPWPSASRSASPFGSPCVRTRPL